MRLLWRSLTRPTYFNERLEINWPITVDNISAFERQRIQLSYSWAAEAKDGYSARARLDALSPTGPRYKCAVHAADSHVEDSCQHDRQGRPTLDPRDQLRGAKTAGRCEGRTVHADSDYADDDASKHNLAIKMT